MFKNSKWTLLTIGLMVAACVTSPTTGNREFDPAKAVAYIEFTEAFNVGLTAGADIAMSVATDPKVKAGALGAKAAVGIANAALANLKAKAQAKVDAQVLEVAAAKTQGAVEAANAVVGAVTPVQANEGK